MPSAEPHRQLAYFYQAIDAYNEQLSNVRLNKATPDRLRREQAQ